MRGEGFRGAHTLGRMLCCAMVAGVDAHGAELPAGWSLEGNVGVEMRLFAQSPAAPAQARDTLALVVNPTLKGSGEGGWETVLTPYVRLDVQDQAVRYGDFREAVVKYRDGEQSWRVGFDTVFWGVMESNHLVDVVNQIDLRADVDMEAKLGQPMVSYTRFLDRYGRIEAFWLPFLRERPGVGVASRQRLDATPEWLQSHGLGRFRRHNDWVVRWSGQVGEMDLGLYHFRGLAREPDTRYQAAGDYPAIRQTGMQGQWPVGNMMWKMEALTRQGQGRSFAAWTAGGEYTVAYPDGDLGFILEWSRDLRDETAPATRYARALFGGIRYRFNELGDSELLFGGIRDFRYNAWSYKLEFSRRLADHTRLGLVARRITAPEESPYAPMRRDANLQLTLSYVF